MMHWRERVKTLAGSLLEPNTKRIFKTNIFKKSDILENIYILYIAKSISMRTSNNIFFKNNKK